VRSKPSALPKPEDVAAVLGELLAKGQGDELVRVACELLGQMHDHARRLEARVAQLLLQTYGRRSEQIDPRQLALLIQAVAKAVAEPASEPASPPPAAAGEASSTPKVRSKPTGRRPLPAALPRERVVYTPPSLACPCCGSERVKIGEETSEMLDWSPATFRVLVHAREKYACGRCKEGVEIAPAPDKVIGGGLPGSGLVAQVVVAKYRDHLPLERQAQIYRRSGVELSPSTLGDWVTAAVTLLSPLSELIFARALSAHTLQVDDTKLRVLDRSDPRHIKRGHQWVLVGDRRWIAFAYTETWEGKAARKLVDKRVGWLQADGYAGFAELFTRPRATAIEVGCMAHARRKFVDALKGGEARAAVAVEIFQRLYRVEREAKDQRLDPEATCALRQKRSAPILDELGRWIAATHPLAPPRSPLGKAIYYTVKRWKQLSRFMEDGALDIDNTAAERALRMVALGRANWMFAGSDAGARRAAVLYTVIATAVAWGVEPWAYVRDLLDKLSGRWLNSRLPELLPDTWRDAHPEALLPPPRNSRAHGDTPPAAAAIADRTAVASAS